MINGATRPSYKIKKKDKGKRISVQITAHRSQYVTGTLTLGDNPRRAHAI